MINVEKSECIPYELGWNKECLYSSESKPIGFDTETNLIEANSYEHPDIALWSVSNGDRTILGHPNDLSEFICNHSDSHFVFHNFAFDFWVIYKHLQKVSPKLIPLLWNKIDKGHFHDSMILDALIRLAQGRGESFEESNDDFHLRNLGEVAKEWAKIDVNKKDPYRMRYGEIIGKEFTDVKEKGFWEYAATDPYATHIAYKYMYSTAKRLVEKYANALRSSEAGKDQLHSWLRYGLLTEQIQIKGSVALAKIERNGFAFDSTKASVDESKYRIRSTALIEDINKARPDFFTKKKGVYSLSKKSHLPSINTHDLIKLLGDVIEKVKMDIPDFQVPQSTGKEQGISRSAEDWKPYEKYDSILQKWIELVFISKRLTFHDIFRSKPKTLFSELESESECVIRSRYNLLMRTGRTSCKNINLQQLPRDKDFRAIFIPREGYKLMTIDYSAIELRTLAATCMNRIHYSVLGDVIKKNVDPHAYTAASILGMKYDEFLLLKKTQPDKYKEARQKAKPVNFGYPGGLGAAKFVAFAQAQYGVTFTLKEAEHFKDKLTEEVYPELSSKNGYLRDETITSIAMNSGLSVSEIESVFEMGIDNRSWIGRVIERIAKGGTTRANGEPYNPTFLAKIQNGLKEIGRISPIGILSVKTKERLIHGAFEPSVGIELCATNAITLTGRIRGNVSYTKVKNTPFQALAADGGKLAMYKLTKLGYRIVAFIHDEMVIEVPIDKLDSAPKEIEFIMNDEMQKLFDCDIPSATEYAVNDYWTK